MDDRVPNADVKPSEGKLDCKGMIGLLSEAIYNQS